MFIISYGCIVVDHVRTSELLHSLDRAADRNTTEIPNLASLKELGVAEWAANALNLDR